MSSDLVGWVEDVILHRHADWSNAEVAERIVKVVREEATAAERARVAKLEAALTKISTAARKDTSLWSASDPLLAFIVGVVDATLWVDKPGG